ncbi:Hsp70 family protein [Streptomyces erythrochromogenes]|uniref:Hsp70 family protein n=1 Tax=Streptomyces erythrochromogenes TaxID=285574 RepID=UPI0034353B48
MANGRGTARAGRGEREWSLAVDLGTCFTTAATFGDEAAVGGVGPRSLEIENSRCLPALVCLDDSGALLTGRAAQQRAAHHPDQAERAPKRALARQSAVLLGGRSVPAAELAAAVLRRVYAEARAAHDGRPPARTVLTHPARWGTAERGRLADAADRAGIAEPGFLPEPVAAALHHGQVHAVPEGGAVAVYDLGGGTFDTAVLRRTDRGFEPVAIGGDPYLGGEDLDECLRDLLGERAADRDPDPWYALWEDPGPPAAAQRALLGRELTAAREALSQTGSVDIAVPGYPQPFLIRAHEYRAAAEPLLDRSYELLAATIADAGLDAADVHEIVLTGGASRTPRVSDLIAERTGRLPLLTADPKSAVVLGALAVLPTTLPPGPGPGQAQAARPAYADGAAAPGGRVRRYLNPDGDLGFRFTPQP